MAATLAKRQPASKNSEACSLPNTAELRPYVANVHAGRASWISTNVRRARRPFVLGGWPLTDLQSNEIPHAGIGSREFHSSQQPRRDRNEHSARAAEHETTVLVNQHLEARTTTGGTFNW